MKIPQKQILAKHGIGLVPITRNVHYLALLLAATLLPPFSACADGVDTWTKRASGATHQLDGVTFGGGQFVAVGVAPYPGSGTILSSPDGVTWTSRDSGTPNDLTAVAYGNGLFVAVGNGELATGPTILTSPDGIIWTSRTAPKTVLNYLNGVTYGNGLFVIVGIGGAILTSTDGVTWRDRSQQTSAPFESVLYANGQFVAVGGSDLADSLIYTSPDGITWTSRNSGITDRLHAIAYGNGVYVATGEYDFNAGQPVILTSPDGITWTSQVLFTSSSALHSVAYDNGEFVAVGGLDTGTSSLLVTSTDGVTWTRKDSATTDTLICISDDQSSFVAVGANGTIIQSGTLGTTQTAAITSPPTTAPLLGPTVTFNWDAGLGVDFYWLRVGTVAGGNDLFEGSWVTSRSQTVENLPQTGQPIYVRLFSAFGTNVLSRDYIYTSALLSLAQALNASGLTWITGGNANWTGQTATTHDGVDAAQSGSVADGQQSWMQTTVTGPGSLSFWWKVDSMTNSDYLNFEVDGVEAFFISGSVAWEQRTVSIATGSHTLLWNYAKDVGTVGADAGWVDEVKWITATQPVLSYGLTAGNFTLTWNITTDHYVPEYSDSLVSPNWTPVGETPSTVGDNFVVTVPPGQTARFFRLHQQ